VDLRLKRLLVCGFILGVSSVLAQVLVLRAALTGFSPNEFSIGILLGIWLFFTGIGSWSAKLISNKLIGVLLPVTFCTSSLLIPVTVFLSWTAKTFFYPQGLAIGPIQVLYLGLASLLILCFTQGLIFGLLVREVGGLNREKSKKINFVYASEVVGYVFGGLLFSLFLLYFFTSYEIALALGFLNIFAALLSPPSNLWRIIVAAWFIVFLICCLSFTPLGLMDLTNERLFPGQTVVSQRSSSFGHISITEDGGQQAIYVNAAPYIIQGSDPFTTELLVHSILLQHDRPKSVLVVGGDISANAQEILKYPSVERVDYLEIDQVVYEVQRSAIVDDPRINIHIGDPRVFLRTTKDRFDVVILDLPDPGSLSINRMYTKEFFSEIGGVLEVGGLVGLTLSGGENYVTDEQAKLLSTIRVTLKKIFENVLVIPGGTTYLIASDGLLEKDYQKLRTGIPFHSEYLEFYIDGSVTIERIESLDERLDEFDSTTNTDFFPVATLAYVGLWSSLFDISPIYFLFVLILIALFGSKLLIKNPLRKTVAAAGFCGIAMEIGLILCFQIVYGYVFEIISIIIAGYMFGSFFGFLFRVKQIGLNSPALSIGHLKRILFFLVIYQLLLATLIHIFDYYPESKGLLFYPNAIFFTLNAFGGFLVGYVFVSTIYLVDQLGKNAGIEAGSIYSADLVGASIGAILISTIIIPILGIKLTFLMGGVIAVLAWISIAKFKVSNQDS